MCPFYYTLQEKFISRAGIKPKTTSDNLFKTTGLSSHSDDSESEQDQIFDGDEGPCDLYDTNNNSESEDYIVDDMPQQNKTPSKPTHNASKKTSSKKLPSRSKAFNTVSNKKSKRNNDGMSSLDHALASLAKHTLNKQMLNEKGKNNAVNNMVILAEQFKRMSDALGSKIKAANACMDFEQFLDREEKRQLQQYKKENEKDLSFSDIYSE